MVHFAQAHMSQADVMCRRFTRTSDLRFRRIAATTRVSRLTVGGGAASDARVERHRGQLVHAATLLDLQAQLVRFHGDVVRGCPLVLRLRRRLEVLGAGAAVAEHPAAIDEPLALLVHAFGERQHREVKVVHALEREVLELL